MSFDITWLREYGSGKICGDLGLSVDTNMVARIDISPPDKVAAHVDWGECAVAVLAAALAGVHHVQWLAEMRETASTAVPEWLERQAGVPAESPEFVAALERHAKTAVGIGTAETGPELDAWTRRRIAGLCGAGDAMCVRESLRILTGLAERACRQVAAAIERKAAAEGPPGSRVHVELALPFIDRRKRDSMWRTLARTEIRVENDGRLIAVPPGKPEEVRRADLYRSALAFCTGLRTGARVYDRDGFSAGWTGRWQLGREAARHAAGVFENAYGLAGAPALWLEGQPQESVVDATLSLSVPGSYASAWVAAPAEGEPEYFAVFSALSVAVQEALRRWLPFVYFQDPERYSDARLALPLLVYQSTMPFVCPSGTHFSYEFLDASPPALGRTSTRARLKCEMARVERLLIAAGKPRIAAGYAQDQVSPVLARVARYPHQYRSLHAADAFLVDELITLAARSRAFRDAAGNPAKAVAAIARHAGRFVCRVEARLRRLYPGVDFSAFGAMLFVEATSALESAIGGSGRVNAVLRLATGGSEKTFANRAGRP